MISPHLVSSARLLKDALLARVIMKQKQITDKRAQ